MRTVALPLLFLVLVCSASAQTNYTTTRDGCSAKNLGYCQLNLVDQDSVPFLLILDHRNNAQGPMDTLTVRYPHYPYNSVFSVHGIYTGLTGRTNGSHTPFYGSGSFLSDDSKVRGIFNYYAWYVATCSGRGCAGSVVGWHYRILAGSRVTDK